MIFKHLNVRPFLSEQDEYVLESARQAYKDGYLLLPKGYISPGVETAVVESDRGLVCSLTGTRAVILDPLIRTEIQSGPELVAAIFTLERTLTYIGQKAGAVDAYIAVPNHLTDYHKIVEKCGYMKTVENCTVFRRPLLPDIYPITNEIMDQMNKVE